MYPERTSLSRFELLKWLNDLLKTDFVRIEQCKDGVSYCLILESLYPSAVPFDLFNWRPTGTDDYIRNHRIIQNAIKELKLEYHGDPDKLGRGSFREHYNFLLWLWQKWYVWVQGGRSRPSPSRVRYRYSPKRFTIDASDDLDLKENDTAETETLYNHSGSPSSTPRINEIRKQTSSCEVSSSVSESIESLRLEREHYYSKLQAVQQLMANHFADTETGQTVLALILHTPRDFQTNPNP